MLDKQHKLTMSIQQTLNFNPPRIVNVPQQPLPQTVCMTLEHSGVPVDEMASITDIPPDFQWMTLLHRYSATFEVSKNKNPKDSLFEENVHVFRETSDGDIGKVFPTWNLVPFVTSRWWNGIISYKLIAIKPPRVTGKLLIRYSFDPNDDFEDDKARRGICKEWDLGQSSECEFDVVACNTIKARPTWLPMIRHGSVTGAYWLDQFLPYQTWHYGSLRIELAQRIQVGSIFPDSIRVLVFKCFKNAEFYLPTDARGSAPHFLATGVLPNPKPNK